MSTTQPNEIVRPPSGPKPFVFVLMPFLKDFDDIYLLGIKPTCENAGAYAERVDEQIFQGTIIERIYNQIAKADILISDMTGRNPNVFYETGYAHAWHKTVILITQHTDDIPFDLKHYPHIVYGGRINELKVELQRRIQWALENLDHLKVALPTLVIKVNDTPLLENTTVPCTIHHDKSTNVDIIHITIDVHRPPGAIGENFFMSFETSNRIHRSDNDRKKRDFSVVFADGHFYHQLNDYDYTLDLRPGERKNLYMRFIGERKSMHEQEPMVLHLHSRANVFEYPFTVAISREESQDNAT